MVDFSIRRLMKLTIAVLIGLTIICAAFVVGIRFVGHCWPRLRLTQYQEFKIETPGISEDGFKVCMKGCVLMQDPANPVLINGKRIDTFSVAKILRYCSVLEVIDYRDEYTEGSEILYDSCSNPKW
jgi:hypothetical protein